MHLQGFQGICVKWTLMNVPARRARTERSAPTAPTNTLANVPKVHNMSFLLFLNSFIRFSYFQSLNSVVCPGYTGQHCEIDINECYSDPCHYGTCKDGLASFTCYCRPGYTGRLCETNINECLSQPCKNGGTCQDRENTYVCYCPKGTAGEASDSKPAEIILTRFAEFVNNRRFLRCPRVQLRGELGRLQEQTVRLREVHR